MLCENTCSDELLIILKKIQADDLFKNHLLVGGTALALQIGHRRSIDIDLFTLHDQDNSKILDYLEKNFNKIVIDNNQDNILQVFVDDIKIDFVKATGKLIKEPICENGLKICSIHDIAGMKLNTINRETGRRKAKDYIDIAYLINELSLSKMFEIYKWKYDKDDVYNVKLDLSDVCKINPYSWQEVDMIRKDLFVSDVPKIIISALEQYNKENGYTVKKRFKK